MIFRNLYMRGHINIRAGAMSLNQVVPNVANLAGAIASNLKNLVVPLHLSQKSSGSMEPLEPPLTPVLFHVRRSLCLISPTEKTSSFQINGVFLVLKRNCLKDSVG